MIRQWVERKHPWVIKPLRVILNEWYEIKKRRNRYLFPRSAPGTGAWLIGTEIKYGGLTTGGGGNRKVSPLDPRSAQQIEKAQIIGGDRMLHHGYAAKYEQYLSSYVNSDRPVVLLEIGIFRGTGLAIWCDLFEEGRIVGLDIDLGHINSHMETLKNLGAFSSNQPQLHEFDQFVDNAKYLESILDGARVDICIDDGQHSSQSILTTIKSVMPHLAEHFVYFIEDNKSVRKSIRQQYRQWNVAGKGPLTVVSGRLRA